MEVSCTSCFEQALVERFQTLPQVQSSKAFTCTASQHFATLLGSKPVHRLMLPLKKLCLITNFLKTWPNLLTFAILGDLKCTTLCSLSTAQSGNTSHIKECWQELSLLLWTAIQTLVGSRLLRGLANLATDHVTQREQNAGWWSRKDYSFRTTLMEDVVSSCKESPPSKPVIPNLPKNITSKPAPPSTSLALIIDEI